MGLSPGKSGDGGSLISGMRSGPGEEGGIGFGISGI
jgi:hypothetical protein